jgi:hypothetical protein
VLTAAAQGAAPIVYGGAALIALERLLRMVMDWQRHRLEMRQLRIRVTGEEASEQRAQTLTEEEQEELAQLLKQHLNAIDPDFTMVFMPTTTTRSLHTVVLWPILRADLRTDDRPV